MAIAHRLAIIIYHMIKEQKTYREAEPKVVDERLQEARKRRAVQQLEQLGFEVSLHQPTQSA